MGANMEVFPWEKLTQLTMDSGVEVWARPVPPYATQEVHSKLPPPPKPKVTLIGADGHEEVKPALPGSPEFEEYTDKLAIHKKEISVALMNFELDYSIVKWRYPGEPEDKSHTQPPKGWTPPSIMEGYGIKYQANRVAFIKIAIIQTLGDQEKLEQVMLGQSSITLDELKAALVPMSSPEEASP